MHTYHRYNGWPMAIDWNSFTPIASLIGGGMIGLAAALLIAGIGRVAGISGIVAGLIRPVRGEWAWRLAFVAGMLLAPLMYGLWKAPTVRIDAGWSMLLVAGLLVGIGTRYGSGCTSGHGVCGVARFSKRSMIATAAFMTTGFVTVYITRHWLGM
jgi:uncharacterized protein